MSDKETMGVVLEGIFSIPCAVCDCRGNFMAENSGVAIARAAAVGWKVANGKSMNCPKCSPAKSSPGPWKAHDDRNLLDAFGKEIAFFDRQDSTFDEDFANCKLAAAGWEAIDLLRRMARCPDKTGWMVLAAQAKKLVDKADGK